MKHDNDNIHNYNKFLAMPCPMCNCRTYSHQYGCTVCDFNINGVDAESTLCTEPDKHQELIDWWEQKENRTLPSFSDMHMEHSAVPIIHVTEDEYAFITRSLERWRDRNFKRKALT